MKLLLDTHAFIWFIDGTGQLSQVACNLIGDSRNEKYISIASAWEVAIKVSKGKLTLASPVEQLFPQQIQSNGFYLLGIEWAHLKHVRELPWHHRDPFDRMLIAQAIVEQMVIVSADAAFDAYSITRLW